MGWVAGVIIIGAILELAGILIVVAEAYANYRRATSGAFDPPPQTRQIKTVFDDAPQAKGETTGPEDLGERVALLERRLVEVEGSMKRRVRAIEESMSHALTDEVNERREAVRDVDVRMRREVHNLLIGSVNVQLFGVLLLVLGLLTSTAGNLLSLAQ